MEYEKNEQIKNFRQILFNDLDESSKTSTLLILTMLADDLKFKSKLIGKSIEDFINQVDINLDFLTLLYEILLCFFFIMIKVSNPKKILGIYLIDSIVQNLKYNQVYKSYFESKIANIFSYVYNNVGIF